VYHDPGGLRTCDPCLPGESFGRPSARTA
jgi:hypothetical protein